MKFKHGVDTTNVCPQIWFALGIACEVFHSRSLLLVVTSMRDGTHSTGSRHYLGQAADLRTNHLTQGEGDSVYADLKHRLDRLGFDVVDERAKPNGPHIHIEWDPKPGDAPWRELVP